MKTSRSATALARGSVSDSTAHAAGLVSRTIVSSEGLCSGHELAPSSTHLDIEVVLASDHLNLPLPDVCSKWPEPSTAFIVRSGSALLWPGR